MATSTWPGSAAADLRYDLSMMTAWIVTFSGFAVIVTIALFVSGALYPRPVVSRIQRAHDEEVKRILRAHEEVLQRERSDCDYFRSAAQSCAMAVAHLEGQCRTLQALLDQCREGVR